MFEFYNNDRVSRKQDMVIGMLAAIVSQNSTILSFCSTQTDNKKLKELILDVGITANEVLEKVKAELDKDKK